MLSFVTAIMALMASLTVAPLPDVAEVVLGARHRLRARAAPARRARRSRRRAPSAWPRGRARCCPRRARRRSRRRARRRLRASARSAAGRSCPCRSRIDPGRHRRQRLGRRPPARRRRRPASGSRRRRPSAASAGVAATRTPASPTPAGPARRCGSRPPPAGRRSARFRAISVPMRPRPRNATLTRVTSTTSLPPAAPVGERHEAARDDLGERR